MSHGGRNHPGARYTTSTDTTETEKIPPAGAAGVCCGRKATDQPGRPLLSAFLLGQRPRGESSTVGNPAKLYTSTEEMRR
jgi:hypothetical protein